MRILQVLAPAYFGGLEEVVYRLAVGQRQSGHDVRVVALVERGTDEPGICSQLRNAGVPVSALAFPPRSFRLQRRAVKRAVAEVRPDVLHTHGYLPDVLSASLVNPGASRVSTVHGFTGGGWRNRIYERMQRASYHRLDGVVAVSTKIAEGLSRSKRVRAKVRTIPNAWTPVTSPLSPQDARAALGLSSQSAVIGWVGRISHEKGLDVMIDALALIKDRKLRLVVIGNGTERKKLEEMAKLRDLDIVWSGHLPDAARYFPAFDIFVLSSRTEGTPMVLFEAMHSLIPIVATSVGGVPAVVSANEASLVPPDNPEALASAIRDALQQPDRTRMRASLAQRRLSESFSPKDWLARYDAVYSEIVGGPKTR